MQLAKIVAKVRENWTEWGGSFSGAERVNSWAREPGGVNMTGARVKVVACELAEATPAESARGIAMLA